MSTFITVPTGRPLGKIWSPPLVSNVFARRNLLVSHDSLENDFAVRRSSQNALQTSLFEDRAHAAALVAD